jgi:serine/threonine protein kinase
MKPGDLVGSFRILKTLGQGAMGVVYLVLDRNGQEMALKTILEEVLSRSGNHLDFKVRFEREAKLAATVLHPNVVRTYGHGEANGTLYLVCELVDGGALDDLLRGSGKCLAEVHALRLISDVLHGLSAMEEKGLVHRDIKPANILLTKNGRGKIADLGLARSTNADRTMLTQPGQILGTPLYMAPEQIEGRENLDIGCDLYAVGAMLYRMLSGSPPFEAKKLTSTLKMHLKSPVPNVCDLSPGVGQPIGQLIKELMAKNRQQRPQKPKDVIQRIESYLASINASSDQSQPADTSMKTIQMDEPIPLPAQADSLVGGSAAFPSPTLQTPTVLTPLGDPARALRAARLVLKGNMGVRTLFLYAQDKLQIGRNAVGHENQDICLRHRPAQGNEDKIRQISGKHLGAFVADGRCWIRDLGSRHGSTLNGQDLPQNQSRCLALVNEVTVARNLRLKISTHPEPKKPTTIGDYGTPLASPSIYIERVSNGSDHSYALIPGRLGMLATPTGELQLMTARDAPMEFLTLNGKLWVRTQGIEPHCCKALEPGLQFSCGALKIQVFNLSPQDQK